MQPSICPAWIITAYSEVIAKEVTIWWEDRVNRKDERVAPGRGLRHAVAHGAAHVVASVQAGAEAFADPEPNSRAGIEGEDVVVLQRAFRRPIRKQGLVHRRLVQDDERGPHGLP